MKSSFLATLVAVLNDREDIPELPNDKLIAIDINKGDKVCSVVPQRLLMKIVRLQTLCVLISKDTEMPSFENTQQVAAITQVPFGDALGNEMYIQDDGLDAVSMIERLIVEIIREAFPSESVHFKVRYVVNINGLILRLPDERRRAFD